MHPEDFIKRYEMALASQDWSNVESLLHESIGVTFSNGAVHEGIAKVKIAFEHNFATIKSEAYHMSNIRWLLKNDATAVYLFDFAWKGIIAGKHIAGNGIGTSVLAKAAGEWRLLAEHLGKK